MTAAPGRRLTPSADPLTGDQLSGCLTGSLPSSVPASAPWLAAVLGQVYLSPVTWLKLGVPLGVTQEQLPDIYKWCRACLCSVHPITAIVL